MDYPKIFLAALLQTFRRGVFLDSSRVSNKSWSLNVLKQPHKLAALVSCIQCGEVREVALAMLFRTQGRKHPLKCELFGFNCAVNLGTEGEDTERSEDSPGRSDGLVPSSLVSPARERGTPWETRPRRGAEDPDLRTMKGTQPSGIATWSMLVGSSGIKPDNEGRQHVPPSHYVVGRLTTRLTASDPEEWEIMDDKRTIDEGEWRKIVQSVTKWMSKRTSCEYAGESNARAFHDWIDRLEKFFDYWPIRNSVTQARIAAVTLEGRADKWWRAYAREKPGLVVTFAQLVEWMRQELVPAALESSSHLSWSRLRYKGDVEAYLQQVEDLMVQHPIDPAVAHVMACEPLGRELVHRIQGMDGEHGGHGISFEALKTQIRSFVGVKSSQSAPRQAAPSRTSGGVQALTLETPAGRGEAQREGKQDSRPARTSKAHCWVCNSTGHLWMRCFRRQPSGCAKCGSHAHEIYMCPPRMGRRNWEPRQDWRLPTSTTTPANDKPATACFAGIGEGKNEVWGESAPEQNENEWGEEQEIRALGAFYVAALSEEK